MFKYRYKMDFIVQPAGNNSSLIRGFTLIEMVVVIVIIGIVAFAALNRLSFVEGMNVNLAARTIVADIRYVQNLAVSDHEEVYIAFSVDNDNYEVYKMDGLNKVYYTRPDTQEPFIVDFTGGQFKGLDITAVGFDTTLILRYNYLGRPLNGNGNDLAGQGQISLEYEGSALTVVVYPGTGFSKVQ
ncbi:MAG: GspH/FimT family protein [Candidatus Omnitrophota bacterium]